MNETTKRYLISSGITFLSAFSLAICAMPISFDTLDKSVIFAIIATGVRAGVKALVEYWQKTNIPIAK